MNEPDNHETADDAGGVTIPAEETDAASAPTSPDAGDTGQDAGQDDTNHDADTGSVTVTPLEPAIPVTVIDLRPPEESVKAELVRLGLCYDRVDQAAGTEIWRDYARHLMAEFPNDAGEPVTLTDIRTGIDRRLTRDQLIDVTRIIVSGEERS